MPKNTDYMREWITNKFKLYHDASVKAGYGQPDSMDKKEAITDFVCQLYEEPCNIPNADSLKQEISEFFTTLTPDNEVKRKAHSAATTVRFFLTLYLQYTLITKPNDDVGNASMSSVNASSTTTLTSVGELSPLRENRSPSGCSFVRSSSKPIPIVKKPVDEDEMQHYVQPGDAFFNTSFCRR